MRSGSPLIKFLFQDFWAIKGKVTAAADGQFSRGPTMPLCSVFKSIINGLCFDFINDLFLFFYSGKNISIKKFEGSDRVIQIMKFV